MAEVAKAMVTCIYRKFAVQAVQVCNLAVTTRVNGTAHLF